MIFFYVAAIVFIVVSIGTTVSHYFLWKHTRCVRKNLDRVLGGKTADEFYDFVNGGRGVNVSDADVEKVEDES